MSTPTHTASTTPTTTPAPGAPTPRRTRSGPLLWAGGALAAAVLVLGVNGTLSSWTSAIIDNNHDTVTTKGAVALSETNSNGSITCDTAGSTTNQVTCAIDKYSGSQLDPDTTTSATATVTFTNTGSGNAQTLRLTPGSCTATDDAGLGRTSQTLCSGNPAADLTVALGCSDGTTYDSASAYTDLAFGPTAPSSLTARTHTATIAPTSSITCQFTVALSPSTPASQSGMKIDQPLTWTLSS